jgi:hypothetical protein
MKLVFKISNFQAMERGALKARFDVTIASGFTFHGMNYFERCESRQLTRHMGPRRWLDFPSRLNEDQTRSPWISIPDPGIRRQFLDSLLKAVDEFLLNGNR